MSFDLNFGRESGSLPAVEDLKACFQTPSSFQITNVKTAGAQFWYQNDATGVYCDFSYYPDETEDEVSRFGASGLTFNLNYIRPFIFCL